MFGKRIIKAVPSKKDIALEKQLRRAIECDEFILEYQPQAALATGRVATLEALIRWNAPELGLIPPGDFLPLAERSDLIQEIGEYVIEKVCAQLKFWQKEYDLFIPVAINFATHHVSERHVSRLEALLRQYDVEPKYIELELTEDATMSNPEESIALMRRLKKSGVSLAIDNFGVGYSNLGYLKRFPVDKLKIDLQFTEGLIDSVEDRAVTAAIIRLGNDLGMRTVAERVEQEGQLRFLLDQGCDAMQGYYFAPALSADVIPDFLLGGTRLDVSALRRRPYSRRLLLLSDDQAAISAFQAVATSEGFDLLTASSVDEASNVLACKDVNVVVSDVSIKASNNLGLLESIRWLHPDMVRVLASVSDSQDCVSDWINRTHPYKHIVTKPWAQNEVAKTLQEAFRHYELNTLLRADTEMQRAHGYDISRCRA